MKLLVAIPHYCYAESNRVNASLIAGNERNRARALEMALRSLYETFARIQYEYSRPTAENPRGIVRPTAQNKIDAVLAVWRNRHILNHPTFPPRFLEAVKVVDAAQLGYEPQYLGVACRQILARNLHGQYDFYCFIEDDLVIHDPLFFTKLGWFNSHVPAGVRALLLPNRFESTDISMNHERSYSHIGKVYLDSLIVQIYPDGFKYRHVTAGVPRKVASDYGLQETITLEALNRKYKFEVPPNPHAGCYFLTPEQLQYWSEQPDFLKRSDVFVGPLESSATLGIMRNFVVYKPAPENADFLEIRHCHPTVLQRIAR